MMKMRDEFRRKEGNTTTNESITTELVKGCAEHSDAKGILGYPNHELAGKRSVRRPARQRPTATSNKATTTMARAVVSLRCNT